MISHRRVSGCAAMAVLVAVFPLTTVAQEAIPVVATFSILGDMVKRIGGDEVEVTTLVSRNGDTHVYQPTPADARAVKKAKLLFTNGLQFEGWLERLAEAAEFDGETVVATDGIEVISMEDHHEDEHGDDEHGDDEHGHHDHGEYDPHGWLSLTNAIVYIDNITAGLATIKPSSASAFYQNREAYAAEIEALDQQIKAKMASLPDNARTIVTSHDAFQYFGRDYGLCFMAPQGLSTDSEASARDVAELIEQIRADGISAVFVENVADPRLLERIADETGSIVGGKLYPGALSESDGPASTYLDLVRHNATTIVDALTAKN